jgi:hypothetical protein
MNWRNLIRRLIEKIRLVGKSYTEDKEMNVYVLIFEVPFGLYEVEGYCV